MHLQHLHGGPRADPRVDLEDPVPECERLRPHPLAAQPAVDCVGIGARPPANPHAEAWIRQGDADALGKGDLYTARLTLDITPAMRARIKVSAFTQGVTVADLLRGLLEREFPEHRRENTP